MAAKMGPTLVLVVLLAAVNCSSARPVEPRGGIASEVSDLLATGDTKVQPQQQKFEKKRTSSVSGKEDAGGRYQTFGSDADGEKGFLKKSFGKAGHGYESRDSFHKKIGDKYGFEEHEAYSAPTKPRIGKRVGDHEGAGTIVESHYVDDGSAESLDGGDEEDGGGSSYFGSGESFFESGGGGASDLGSYEGFSGEGPDGSYY